jgi:hypothetical protein
MTYETIIKIEIAGIRRALRVVFEYHVENVEGELLPILDEICVLTNRGNFAGKWVYQMIGPRQLKELQGRMIKQLKVL